MHVLRQLHRADPRRRGAALMLSFLVLIVLIVIVQQISYSAKTDARVSRNEETLIAMDQAIESVLLEAYESLKVDGEGAAAASEGGGGGNPFGGGGAAAGGFGGAGGEGEEGEGSDAPTDSREDDWARPKRTEMNELQLRVLIQDEDSKYNVLSILDPDPEKAQAAFERLERVIANARKGTRREIDSSTASRMANSILEFMNRRMDQVLPRPNLLSDDQNNDDIGLPLTLRELVALDADLFPPDLFRDMRDEDGIVVHSLGSFLTVWSSMAANGDAPSNALGGGSGAPPEPDEEEGEGEAGTGEGSEDPFGQGGQGGEGGESPGGEEGTGAGAAPDPAAAGAQGGGGDGANADGRINVNTAPRAVLEGLLDDRDLPYDFWRRVVEYRNEPQEDEDDYGSDPLLEQRDEFGEELVPRQFFSSIDDLSEIDSWVNIEPVNQGELQSLLKTQSSVFSIFVTARRPTGEEEIDAGRRREDIEQQEAEGQGLVRTVRSVVWRRVSGGTVEIVPIVRWEVVDSVPYEVVDFPGEDR